MNNIFVEGLQGTGKSTLLGKLEKELPEYQVYKEGDLSPVELAWCSYMTNAQYEEVCMRYKGIYEELERYTVSEGNRKITAYTHILTDIEGFHKYMHQFEIYNGNIAFQEFKEIILKRYSNFNGNGAVFECSFFQNSMECMLLYYQMSDDEIMDFYREAYAILISKNFRLLYIDTKDIEGTIDTIRRERTDMQGNEIWFSLMLQFLETSPYGMKYSLKTLEGLIAHLKRRREIELKIVDRIIGKNACVIPSKNYEIEKIKAWIGNCLEN